MIDGRIRNIARTVAKFTWAGNSDPAFRYTTCPFHNWDLIRKIARNEKIDFLNQYALKKALEATWRELQQFGEISA